jgi:long-chain acyl-CoA synthetase
MFFTNDVYYRNRIAVVTARGEHYTYGHLFKTTNEINEQLKSEVKQLVLVLARNDYRSLVHYIAALQRRDTVMLVNHDLPSMLIHDIIDLYKPAIVIGNIQHGDYILREENVFVRKEKLTYAIHPDLALLMSTSGTTGSVKFVRLSYQNIAANAEAIASYLRITSEDRGVAQLPIHYSYGLSIINSHLYRGATVLLTEDSVLTKSFWDFVKEEKATSLAGVPYTYQMLARIRFHEMDLPDLRYFTQAGGRLSEKFVRLFGEYAIRTGKQFFVMYGQTEATARISYVPPERLLEKPTSIGQAIPGGTLYIDKESEELIYEGPNVMLGYATSYLDLIKGDEFGGRLRTGDLAYVDDEGFFYIKGRLKRFLKLFGLRLNLDEIEKRLESVVQAPVFCVGNDEKLAVITIDEAYVEQICSAIEHLYKLHRTAFFVHVMSDIPTLPNGKINYEKIKDLVL